MKKKFLTLSTAIIIAFSTVAFTTIEKEKKEIKVKKSTITWKGYKVTGSHYGTITLKNGYLTFEDKKLNGGKFVMDMTSINTTDLEGGSKQKLDGHLKSDDFFGVKKYPTATLIFTKVKPNGKNAYQVTGNLTIKKKTHPVSFQLSVYGNKATGNLKIDRSKYDVRYGSGSFFDNLGDKTIYDEFDLVVDLEF